MTPDPLPRNPYVGPRPFEQNDADLFFGREGEVRELLSHVVANKVVLLYATSGAGKTSLLNAGVIPLLEREERFEVLPVARLRRLDVSDGGDAGTGNVYVAATLLNWRTQADAGLPPPRMKDFLEALPRGQDPRGRRLARAVFFDQFEELFTVYPEFWEERGELFEQLVEALDDDPHLHVVLALREDYLAHLDPYLPLLPTVTRFRLERLGPEAALQATKKPLETRGRRFAPGVAEELVSDMRELRVDTGRGGTVEVQGEFVEPVHLQVVCHNIWSALPPDVLVIDAEHRERFGDVDEVLSQFYSEAMAAAAAVSGIREADLRRRFETAFITPIGTRDSQFYGPTETARLPNAAIGELEKRHVLRGEEKGLARRLELTHDRLIEPIRHSNELYRSATRRRQRRRLFAAGVVIAAVAGAIVAGLFTFAAVGDEPQAFNPVVLTVLRPLQPTQMTSAAFSPNGRFVVTASGDGVARVWDWQSRPEAPISVMRPAFPQALFSAAFSPDGEFVVTAGSDGTARVWNWTSTPPARVSVLRQNQAPLSAAFSPDGKRVVTSSEDGTARVWDARQADVIAVLPGARSAGQSQSAAFSPDGKLVVTTSDEGSARLWDWAAVPPGVVATLTPPTSPVERISGPSTGRPPLIDAAFSPNGKLVVTSDAAGTAIVWDARKETILRMLPSPTETAVPSAAFSGNGELVVTASTDGGRVWGMRPTPNVVALLRRGRTPSLTSAEFSPNGKLVVTASQEGVARVWDLHAPKRPE